MFINCTYAALGLQYSTNSYTAGRPCILSEETWAHALRKTWAHTLQKMWVHALQKMWASPRTAETLGPHTAENLGPRTAENLGPHTAENLGPSNGPQFWWPQFWWPLQRCHTVLFYCCIAFKFEQFSAQIKLLEVTLWQWVSCRYSKVYGKSQP